MATRILPPFIKQDSLRGWIARRHKGQRIPVLVNFVINHYTNDGEPLNPSDVDLRTMGIFDTTRLGPAKLTIHKCQICHQVLTYEVTYLTPTTEKEQAFFVMIIQDYFSTKRQCLCH